MSIVNRRPSSAAAAANRMGASWKSRRGGRYALGGCPQSALRANRGSACRSGDALVLVSDGITEAPKRRQRASTVSQRLLAQVGDALRHGPRTSGGGSSTTSIASSAVIPSPTTVACCASRRRRLKDAYGNDVSTSVWPAGGPAGHNGHRRPGSKGESFSVDDLPHGKAYERKRLPTPWPPMRASRALPGTCLGCVATAFLAAPSGGHRDPDSPDGGSASALRVNQHDDPNRPATTRQRSTSPVPQTAWPGPRRGASGTPGPLRGGTATTC